MPENGNEEQQERKQAEWVAPPGGVIEIYANNVHLQWTLDDVRVRLAQLISDPERPTPGTVFSSVFLEKAAVTLTWRNAKLFRNQLSHLIQNYEELNGEIATDLKLAKPEGSATR